MGHYAYYLRTDATQSQSETYFRYAGGCRFLYNLALEQRNLRYFEGPLPTMLELARAKEARDALRKTGIKPKRKESAPPEKGDKKEVVHKITYASQSAEIKILRSAYPWLNEIPFCCLQETLRNLDRAFVNFFKNKSRYPVFHKKSGKASVNFPPNRINIKELSDKAGGTEGLYYSKFRVVKSKIGEDVGLLNVRTDRPILGIPKSTTLKFEGDGHWWLSITTEQEIKKEKAKPGKIGIDLGVVRWIALSNGLTLPVEDKHIKTVFRIYYLRGKLKRALSRLDRRKVRGSNNFKKEQAKIRSLKWRIAKATESVIHEMTDYLTKNYDYIAVEALRVKNMTASAKGTIENPGKNVKQKAGLNRSLLEKCFGKVVEQIIYKAEWRGGEVHKVNPANTSITCSSCHYTNEKNRIDQPRFLCKKCGFSMNADENAAKNILRLALDESALLTA